MMRRGGFSLLEVVIATAILLAASMTLLRLLSIGRQHQVRAEKRAIAQSLCQTLIDEHQAGVMPIRPIDYATVPQNPNWSFSVDQQSTQVAGVLRLRIRVWESEDSDQGRKPSDPPAFELVRWMRKSTDGDQR